MKFSRFTSTVLETRELSPTVKHIRFSTPEDFSHNPGQFISMLLEHEGREVRKPYSIASAPAPGYVELCVKLVEGGLGSTHLHNLSVGDEVNFIGPMGIFKVRDKEKPITFICTGTGIAPFRAMIPFLLKEGHSNVRLFMGFRFEEEILYVDEFAQMAKEHDGFDFHYCVSRPHGDYSGEVGRVQALVENHSKGYEGDFYLCGLFDMIKETGAFLRSHGVERSCIRFERYD